MTHVNSNPIARKYCIKATAAVYNQYRVYGHFVGYGKTMEVGKNIENACKMCVQDTDSFPECVWDDIEITIFEDCPVECSAAVQWIAESGVNAQENI